MRDHDSLQDVFEPGDILDGKYRVMRLVGVGGMGAVYEGRNVRLDRPVAIKMMHADIARDSQAVARFEREAQAAARIGSRHIVDVLDLGALPEGERYMVMEYLEGETVATRLKRVGTMPVAEAARIAVQLLEGLTKVHDAGIVHRDLKPPNIFLANDEDKIDFVKILDFGVCKIAQSKAANGPSTGVGDVLGTLGYMAPEQLEHGPAGVDARADLYAVGVLIYRAVAGRLPYAVRNLVEHLSAMRERRTSPLSDIVPDADPKFSAIVDRAIDWDREARFQDARSMHRALVTWIRSTEEMNKLLADFLDREPPVSTSEPSVASRSPARPSQGPESLDLTKRAPPAQTVPNVPAGLPPVRPPAPSFSELATGKLPQRQPSESDIEVDFDLETGKRS
jgi:eukaryotic-like serine/threonine-protein kinase